MDVLQRGLVLFGLNNCEIFKPVSNVCMHVCVCVKSHHHKWTETSVLCFLCQ